MKYLLSIISAAFAALSVWAGPEEGKNVELKETDAAVAASNVVLPFGETIPADSIVVIVSVAEQRAIIAQGGKPLKSFLVSTAKAGTGARENSGKTPLGWHKVASWIGEDARPGQVFVSRRATSEVIPSTCWNSTSGEDKVLTRIMWLEGLERGINKGRGIDSYSRFIYLHGTNQEHLLGTPASHGCIRFSNRDILEIFHISYGRPAYCRIVECF